MQTTCTSPTSFPNLNNTKMERKKNASDDVSCGRRRVRGTRRSICEFTAFSQLSVCYLGINRSKCVSIARTRAREKVRFRISPMHEQEPDLQGMQQAVVSDVATMPAITSDASILFVYHLIDNENEHPPDTF